METAAGDLQLTGDGRAFGHERRHNVGRIKESGDSHTKHTYP